MLAENIANSEKILIMAATCDEKDAHGHTVFSDECRYLYDWQMKTLCRLKRAYLTYSHRVVTCRHTRAWESSHLHILHLIYLPTRIETYVLARIQKMIICTEDIPNPI